MNLSHKSLRTLFHYFSIIFLIFSIAFNSCRNDRDDDIVSKEIKEVNQWILDNMKSLYLWNNKIPAGLSPGREADPEEFFYKMIYKAEDKWSYITPDMDALLAELDGVPLSSGISPAFVRIGDNSIVLIVEFVYPDSPAERAGLQRGDLILSINGQNMTLDNYNELFNQPVITVRKGIMTNNGLIPDGEAIRIVSEIISSNPVIHYEAMNVNGIKTGYLVYSAFISGIEDIYLDSLDNALKFFKNEDISELIIDLRYNRGGEISAAGYLASGIAPRSAVTAKDVIVKFIYNQGLTNYFKKPGTDARNLGLNFPPNLNNLNLDKVYFLTGWKTASASELVIIGLKPYMNVITIGEPTYGKYTGSWVLTDTNNPPKHKWAMLPIVMKYANKDGYTDFKNGLPPDYVVEDFLLDLKPFGDPGDPLLAKAKELIGGIKTSAVLTVKPDLAFRRIDDELMKRSSWLIMDKNDFLNYTLPPAP